MASALRLESGRGGRLKRQLVQDVKDFVAAEARYERKRKELKQQFAGVHLDKLVRPAMPEPLAMWFELQRWPGSLLWEGGLLDQPAWIWDLIDLAGMVYHDTTRVNVEAVQDLMKDEQPLGT